MKKDGTKVSQEYAKRFENGDYAERYDSAFRFDSLSDLLRPRNITGWMIAELEKSAVERLLSHYRGCSILDAPCGSGKLFPRLIEQRHTIIGIDISKEMLTRIPRTEMEKSQLIRGDLRKIPLANESVDVVICVRFIHRIPEQDHGEVLREIYRVCKNNAIIYFSIRDITTNYIVAFEKFLKLGDRGDVISLSKSEIEKEIASAGFKLERMTRVLPFLSTGCMIIGRKGERIEGN